MWPLANERERRFSEAISCTLEHTVVGHVVAHYATMLLEALVTLSNTRMVPFALVLSKLVTEVSTP